MPSLGADMEEGILLEWLVKPGDVVHRGDIVAVVETPKSAVEVETFDDGTVERLLVDEGQTVPVGAVLADLGAPGGAGGEVSVPRATGPPAAAPPAGPPPAPAGAPQAAGPPAAAPPVPLPVPGPPAAAPRRPSAVPAPSVAPAAVLDHVSPVLRHRAHQLGVDLSQVTGTGPGGVVTRADVEGAGARPRRLRASPLARRLAQEVGLELASVPGTGADGTIRADDVRRAAALVQAQARAGAAAHRAEGPATAPEAAPTTGGAQARRVADMRHAIATLMARSNREVPHYYLSLTIDLQHCVEWVRERNRELPMAQRLVPAAPMLAAVARAVREVPELNGHWVDDELRPADRVNLGLILSLRGGGLLVPAIRDADRLTMGEVMTAIRELTRRARAGRLRGSDLVTPSITVSNLGDQGAESVHGVIYPPQVALVGFGAVSQRPWAVDGLLGVRPLVTATLAGDHRATDGATGARLLKAIDRLLQRPEEL